MSLLQRLSTAAVSAVPAPEPETVLQISLFDGCSLSFGGREVAIANKKGKALLGYLAFTRHHSETRERLVGMFWSEMAENKARANLRQTLHSLRDTLETAGFKGFNTMYSDPGFEPGTVRFDAIEALDSVASNWPTDVLVDRPRVADTLLAGFEDVDSSFSNWLAVQRESLAQKLTRELQDRLDINPDNSPAARRLALALLQLDPTHEPACRCVMRAQKAAGDTAGAIATYNRLCEVLDSEYGQPPDQATADLVVAIKNGSYQPPERGPAVATAPLGLTDALGPPALQVAPIVPAQPAAQEKLVLIIGTFEHIGDRRELTFAFRHELISRLYKFREWLLVDGEPSKLPVNGCAPCYTLSAPLMEGEDDVNLFLSLKDTRTGAVLWSERFNIELKTFFKSLQEVMRQIAAKLNVYISAERLTRVGAAPDVSLDIYDRWLRGQALIQQWQPGNRRRARQVFESITLDAPHYSPAYSSLTQMDNADHIVFAGTYRTIEVHQRALSRASTAVRLDPLDSRAHLALAWANAMCGNHDLAASQFDQACSLNENDSWTMTSAALGYAYGDRPEQAAITARKATMLTRSPMPLHWCYQSTVRFLNEDFEGCVDAAAQAGDSIGYLFAWRAAALAHLDETADARAVARQFVEHIRSTWFGETKASEVAISRWLLHCFPICNPASLAKLRLGLNKAGLETPGA